MSYIRAKLGILVPSQVRALRLKSDMSRQADLAEAVAMKQSRISMLETPGAANVTLETLARLAAVFAVGLVVKFVPFSEMLHWEDTFSQDTFDVIRLNKDEDFLNPGAHAQAEIRPLTISHPRQGIQNFVSALEQGTARPERLPSLVPLGTSEHGALAQAGAGR